MNVFNDYHEKYTNWMRRLGYAETTITGYTRQLATFLEWLTENHFTDLQEITQTNLETYCQHLHHKKNKLFGGALSSNYIQSHINVIRLLDKYLQLTGESKILKGRITVEKGIKQHRTILSQEEIKLLYNATGESVLGYRDKAILSIYYGCGLRSGEGERLKIHHIHYDKGLLQVLPGKNYKGRYVPMNDKIMQGLKDYQQYSRHYLQEQPQEAFIIGSFGNPMKGTSMNTRLKILCERAGIEKQISLHGLRHSIATHLLQQGMPLEQISRFLGHTSLDSTQIYTRLAEEIE